EVAERLFEIRDQVADEREGKAFPLYGPERPLERVRLAGARACDDELFVGLGIDDRGGRGRARPRPLVIPAGATALHPGTFYREDVDLVGPSLIAPAAMRVPGHEMPTSLVLSDSRHARHAFITDPES